METTLERAENRHGHQAVQVASRWLQCELLSPRPIDRSYALRLLRNFAGELRLHFQSVERGPLVRGGSVAWRWRVERLFEEHQRLLKGFQEVVESLATNPDLATLPTGTREQLKTLLDDLAEHETWVEFLLSRAGSRTPIGAPS